MTLKEFQDSQSMDSPPAALAAPLRGLWWDARGDWKQAHAEVDALTTVSGMAVHAYLHRKEGDEENAKYWYRQAGRPFPSASLSEESRTLLQQLLLSATDSGLL